jgi:cytochrome c5
VKKSASLVPCFLVLVVSAAFAPVNAGTVPGKGNEAKGRFYFRQTCKECHTKAAKGGEVTPLSRTQAQWRRYFTKGRHVIGGEELTKFFNAEQLKDLETFLYNHAADSPQPETCGK